LSPINQDYRIYKRVIVTLLKENEELKKQAKIKNDK